MSGGSAANLTALLVALRAVTSLGDDRRVMRDYRVQTLAGLLRLWFENSQDSWRDFGPVRR